MKEKLTTPEAFAKFLAEGHKRAPSLYSGQMKHEATKEVPEEKKAGSVAMAHVVKPGSKPWTGDERKDWAMRAANDSDWDGREE